MRLAGEWSPKDELLMQLRAVGLPDPTPEYRFSQERRYRFDWAWPERKVALEYDGIFSFKSRHRTVHGYSVDLDKMCLAQKEGWLVVRVGADQVRSGLALEALQAVYESREENRGCQQEEPAAVL